VRKIVFVSGGVISGVGKGIVSASLGKILSEYGYNVTIMKADPYFNFDAGTLRPTEHGEVWVTDDGGEIDQDLGNYERFLNKNIPQKNNMTSGQVYKAVIDKERAGGYLGKTVQFFPHIPQEVARRIKSVAKKHEFTIIEIGGMVGDYENVPFLFAAKALERELGFENVAHILVTYLPIPEHIGEMKTRPTRRAIRMLRQEGIFPDFIICRAERSVDEHRKKKIDVLVHITSKNILSAPNLETIYEVPLYLHKQNIGKKVLKRLNLEPRKTANLTSWKKRVNRIKKPKQKVQVAICGKYLATGDYDLSDSYVSVREALIHAGAQCDVGVEISWLRAKEFLKKSNIEKLKKFDGIIVPGGFGKEGIEGKINVINFAREHNVPYLGLCYGMQLACIEFARNVCGMKKAHTTEIDPYTKFPIVDFLPEQKRVLEKEGYGGTMRLGGYPAVIEKKSRVFQLYKTASRLKEDAVILEKLLRKKDRRLTKFVIEALKKKQPIVIERHRHRYELNPEFIETLEQHGLLFSGKYGRADGTQLMEFVELPEHKFFVATQAHPEFKSRLESPAPLFLGFVKACLG